MNLRILVEELVDEEQIATGLGYFKDSRAYGIAYIQMKREGEDEWIDLPVYIEAMDNNIEHSEEIH